MGLLHVTAVVIDLTSKRHTQPPPLRSPTGGGVPRTFAPWLLFFGGVLLVASITCLAYAMQRARRQGFQQLAMELNLSYTHDDQLGLLGYPFTLFTRGDDRRIENVIWGTWHEVDVIAFDFMYSEGSGKERTDYRFDCAVVPIDADGPRLLIEHENLMTSLAGALSFHDQQFESEAFNDEYRVHCEVPKFANDVLDARMMQWLLEHGADYGVEVVGNRVLVAGPKISPTELVQLIGTAKGFIDHVPEVVFSVYPVSG